MNWFKRKPITIKDVPEHICRQIIDDYKDTQEYQARVDAENAEDAKRKEHLNKFKCNTRVVVDSESSFYSGMRGTVVARVFSENPCVTAWSPKHGYVRVKFPKIKDAMWISVDDLKIVGGRYLEYRDDLELQPICRDFRSI